MLSSQLLSPARRKFATEDECGKLLVAWVGDMLAPTTLLAVTEKEAVVQPEEEVAAVVAVSTDVHMSGA